jgi:hypothetical protein
MRTDEQKLQEALVNAKALLTLKQLNEFNDNGYYKYPYADQLLLVTRYLIYGWAK